jgi:hypothetical protein
MAMSLNSPEFQQNGHIPSKYTCEAEDVSPPLAWEGVPNGALQLPAEPQTAVEAQSQRLATFMSSVNNGMSALPRRIQPISATPSNLTR